MGKPTGIGLVTDGHSIGFSVDLASKVEDAIWDAVEEAINAGWTPERFKSEAADAWRDRLKQDADNAVRVLSK